MSTRSPGRSSVWILSTLQEPLSASSTSMVVGTSLRPRPSGLPSESVVDLAVTLNESALSCGREEVGRRGEGDEGGERGGAMQVCAMCPYNRGCQRDICTRPRMLSLTGNLERIEVSTAEQQGDRQNHVRTRAEAIVEKP